MDDKGLIYGYLLDGAGGGKEIGWDAVENWEPGQGLLWVHLDRDTKNARRWVRKRSGVGPVTAEALLAEETRPRSFPTDQGLVVILRGVNLNPGEEPEDMVAVRIFIDRHRIITIRNRKVIAAADIAERLGSGEGPLTAGDFLAIIADALVARMEPFMDELGASVDEIETSLLELAPGEMRKRLRDLRNTAIALKRYLAPQRDAMARLQLEQLDALSDLNRLQLREVGDRVTRYVEELEEVRERAIVLQDELLNALSQTTNRTIYILTIVAAVMLPLSLITGLFGINVGGMPGIDEPNAFWIVCLLLLAFGLGQAWLFRRLKWL